MKFLRSDFSQRNFSARELRIRKLAESKFRIAKFRTHPARARCTGIRQFDSRCRVRRIFQAVKFLAVEFPSRRFFSLADGRKNWRASSFSNLFFVALYRFFIGPAVKLLPLMDLRKRFSEWPYLALCFPYHLTLMK